MFMRKRRHRSVREKDQRRRRRSNAQNKCSNAEHSGLSTSQATFTPTHNGRGKEMGVHARRGRKKKRKGSWEVWNPTGVLTGRIFSRSSQHSEPIACPCGDGDAEARRGSASFTGRRAIASTPLRRRSEEAAKGPLQGLAPVGIFAKRVFSEFPPLFRT